MLLPGTYWVSLQMGVSSSPSALCPATHILLGDPTLLLSYISVMSQLPSLGATAQAP